MGCLRQLRWMFGREGEAEQQRHLLWCTAVHDRRTITNICTATTTPTPLLASKASQLEGWLRTFFRSFTAYRR